MSSRYESGHMPESRFSTDLLREAQRIAHEMIKSEEQIRSFPVGDRADALWVSRDARLVAGSQHFSIDGVEFYVGIRVENL